MKEETMHRLIELEEIHLQLHCAVESVRQSWVALTQGDNMPTEADYDALWGCVPSARHALFLRR